MERRLSPNGNVWSDLNPKPDGTPLDEISFQIEDANHQLSMCLIDLKHEGLSRDAKTSTMRKANQIMEQAIVKYPDRVHSVVVQLKEGIDQKTGEIDSVYDDHSRDAYQNLLQSRRSAQEPDINTLVIPLPYYFSTGIAGSAEREAMSASNRQIFFNFARRKDNLEDKQPVLDVVIKTSFFGIDTTIFLPEEVIDVQLSPRDDFSPIMRYWDKSTRRENFVRHYLGFRGFEATGEERFVNSDVPFFVSTMRLDSELKKFIALNDTKSGDTILFELLESPSQARYSHSYVADVIQAILDNESNVGTQSSSKTYPYSIYQGNDVIRRLAQIPVANRFF